MIHNDSSKMTFTRKKQTVLLCDVFESSTQAVASMHMRIAVSELETLIEDKKKQYYQKGGYLSSYLSVVESCH